MAIAIVSASGAHFTVGAPGSASLTAIGTAYTQDFNTLASTGTSASLPAGWAFFETGTATAADGFYTAGTGSGNAGDVYSFGCAASTSTCSLTNGAATDRAFGTLLSSTNTPTIGASFTNNTGATISSLAIAYRGEEWRLGTAGRTDALRFQYSLDATDLQTGTWVSVSALDFVTPNTATTGGHDGNGATGGVNNFQLLSATINGLSIPNGAVFWIRWNDVDAASSDDGLAIDDFSLTPGAGGSTNPSGTGAASPASVVAGGTTLLTVATTPGTNPPAAVTGVTADLSSIGGSATQTFYDDGTNGDLHAGDNIFSFGATVSGSTGTGAKSIAATIADAQTRTGNATISLTVPAPTSLSGAGAANPAAVQAGNATLLTVTVTPANSPASTGIAVNADLSTISGSAVQPFFDDATHGDLVAGDNVFSFSATIPSDAASGARTLPFAIADAQGGSASGAIGLTVTSVSQSTSPSGTGSAVLSSVPVGGTTQLTVNVTPGTNPASTGLSVIGDLSSIGGSNAQGFQASGNTFSFSATVGASTTLGAKTLPITVSDTQGRSSGFTIPLTVTAPLANSTVVISQIYAGSTGSGATYANDYVQLYNRGNATVDLTGWSIQYAAAGGTGDWSSRQPLGGTIAPGQYYLIAMAAGGAAGAASLPLANVTSQINMGQSAGKLAITDNGDLLTGSGGCPDLTHVKDLVGYGSTADCWEGSGPATVTGALITTALFRQAGGAIDTNDNKNDFSQAGPNPFTTTPFVTLPPAVFATYPTVNDTDIPRDATIEVTFTEAVAVDPGWFDVHCPTTGSHDDATEAPDGINRWITPNTNFVAGELCTVTVFSAKVHDAATGTLSPPHDFTWTFTVASGAAAPETPDVHLLMGNPTNATADITQPNNYLMSKPEYTLSYNRDLGRPNWVSWHLSAPWIPVVHGTRVDTFRPDPQIPPDWYRVQSFDFSGSGFDRGHMDPNADRENSIPVNQATFLMSNMVAQSHDNNAGPWEDLENYLRSVVLNDPNGLNEVYIISGPLGTGGTGTNGFVTTTAAGHVTVPTSTWKVALVLPDNGTEDDLSRVTCSTRTIAIITPNITGIINDPWQKYLTTVSDIESKTGYHFFTNLPQPIQNCIKAGTNGVNPKNDQTISFGPLTDQPFGFDVALQATASSGLAVTLAVTSGPATIVNGTTLHITGVGPVTVQATQAGNVNYNAAAPVSQSFNVTPGSQNITFAAPAPSPTFGDPAFQVSATGGPSGNPVTFTGSGTCTLTSQPGVATITIVSAGVCTVTASQAGSATYNAAPQVSEAFSIGKATPSFTGLISPTIEAGTATTTLGGSLGLGVLIPTGTITVTLNGVTQTGAIQANGSFASAFATGLLPPTATPFAIAYTYAGDGNFNGAAGVAALTVVDTTPPTIDAHANLTAEATGASGAAVTYSAPATHDAGSGDGVASCSPGSGSTFPIGTATVTCTATDAHGNSASGAFTVTVTDHTAPTLNIPANITTTATTPSGATVTFTTSASDSVDGIRSVVCSPSSGSTFPIGVTTVTCTAADTRGNSVSRSFTVTVTAPSQAGLIVGAGSIAAGAVTYKFDFLAQERGSGADLSAISYHVTTVRPGPDQQDEFVAIAITGVSFFNLPGVTPGARPPSGIDTVTFAGKGLWNGHTGYTFSAQATDAGEPGRGRDLFSITVMDASGHVVSSVSGTITDGNIQSLR